MGAPRENRGGRSRPPMRNAARPVAARRRRLPVPSKTTVAWVTAATVMLGLPSSALTVLAMREELAANKAAQRGAATSADAAKIDLETERIKLEVVHLELEIERIKARADRQ